LEKINLKWDPCVGVGEFIFGADIKPLIGKYNLLLVPDEYKSQVAWNSYSVSDKDMRIYTEDERIIAVACYEECWINGINLLGLSLTDIIKVMGIVKEQISEGEEYEINDEVQFVYEIDDLGAQLWIQDGHVITIICSSP
jgi:hypothetical protein